MLIAIVLLGAALAAAGFKLQSYRHQQEIADSLADGGAEVVFRLGNARRVSYSAAGVRGLAEPLSHDVIGQINQLKHVEKLDFSFTDLSDELLSELHGLEALYWLRVDCTSVTSNGIENLTGFPSLQIISVLVDQLDDDTERKLQERFPGIYIEKLRLVDGRRIGDEYFKAEDTMSGSPHRPIPHRWRN